MVTYYDPETQPDCATWLELGMDERMRVAKNFRDSARIRASKDHAYIHVFVEDQIAFGFRPVLRALARLQKEGLGRHQAIHAIGAVFREYWRNRPISLSSDEQSQAQLRLNAAFDGLSAKTCKGQ